MADKKTGETSESDFAEVRDVHFSLSPSVSRALERLKEVDNVPASQIVNLILADHSEYAKHEASGLQLRGTSVHRSPANWLDDAQTLVDPEAVTQLAKSPIPSSPPVFHGRLAIVTLALLDNEVRQQLEENKVFELLVSELSEPIEQILTSRGRNLYRKDLADSVSTWPDDPLKAIEADLLGRAPFAKYIANRIKAIPPESGAYSIHIFGPWGSGKSTLLNFLRTELSDQDEDWLVIDFNAWRHQHIDPPWWSLLDRTFRQTKHKLTRQERFAEYWWRLNTGNLSYIIIFVVALWILGLFIFPGLKSGAGNNEFWEGLSASAENLTKIIALVTTFGGAVLALNRSLLLGSSRAAQNLVEITNEPMEMIHDRFSKLIERLKPCRVAIFIDDLDRCRSQYAVELLEGMQTLFRDDPIVYIVAADKSWLNACYSEIYEAFEPSVSQVGKPLGSLFMEKAFRFSTPMPGLSPELKEAYWKHLLDLENNRTNIDTSSEVEAARRQVANAMTERELIGIVNDSRSLKFNQRRAIQEAAVVKLATPEITQRIEHVLVGFLDLIEANPRTMKRLVNAYSANRALAILSEIDIDTNQLILWTILSMRFPMAADVLVEDPALLDVVGQPNSSHYDEKLVLLLNEDEVTAVLKSPHHNQLEKNSLEKCARLWA